MSGISVECEFSLPQPKLLAPALEGLTRGETGALFQDRMDHFGEAIAKQLEELLERWPSHYFEAQGYERKKTDFWIEFVVESFHAASFAKDISKLFQACGVKELHCSLFDSSGD